jgi:hypothetical protein
MSIESRVLYTSENGDRWSLARNVEVRSVFIRHEPNRASGGRPSDIDIGRFLADGSRGPEHQELLRLIGILVEDDVSAHAGSR